jgi:hypothetical protein
MEDGSIDPALPEFFQDDLNGDPLQDLNLLTEFLDPRETSQFMTENNMADIGISESDIIGEVERFNSPDEMLIVEQQVSPSTTQLNTEHTEYARSVDSGAGSLSPTSNQSSPTSTPLHGHIAVSIQPQKQRNVGSTRQKKLSKAKKPRLEIKVEPDSDHEYQEDDISYIETNNKQTNIESNKVHVTQEEQEVLDREGWELTEKNLKKARRKIKNKISAQESRKRKRDYLNGLEERLTDFTTENQQLKRDLEKERNEKKSILSQLRELQAVVGSRFQPKNVKTSGTQTSAAVMVVLLCCTIFKGTFSSSNDSNEQNDSILHELNEEFDYSTPSYKSRVLKCFTDDDVDFCQMENGLDVPVMDFDQSDIDSDLDDSAQIDPLFGSEGISKLTAGFNTLDLEDAFVATGENSDTVNTTTSAKIGDGSLVIHAS